MHERLCTLLPVLVRAAVKVHALHVFVLGAGIPWLDRMLYIL